MDGKAIDKIFSIFEKENPNPQIELDYINEFTLLVAVVLSAQATDISVNKVTKTLFENYYSPSRMLKLGEVKLKNHIKTIGLYNSKAKNIILTSKILVEKYSEKIPSSLEELTQLPGVGRKSANVVLNTIFGHKTMPVDTHVFRVSKRLGLASGNTPIKIENELVKIIPKKMLAKAHHWLVLHGRYVCKAMKPQCPTCKIKNYCQFPKKRTL